MPLSSFTSWALGSLTFRTSLETGARFLNASCFAFGGAPAEGACGDCAHAIHRPNGNRNIRNLRMFVSSPYWPAGPAGLAFGMVTITDRLVSTRYFLATRMMSALVTAANFWNSVFTRLASPY